MGGWEGSDKVVAAEPGQMGQHGLTVTTVLLVQMVTVSTRVETFLVVGSQPAVQHLPTLSVTTRPSVSQLYSFSLLCLPLLDLQSASCTASAYFVCNYYCINSQTMTSMLKNQ